MPVAILQCPTPFKFTIKHYTSTLVTVGVLIFQHYTIAARVEWKQWHTHIPSTVWWLPLYIWTNACTPTCLYMPTCCVCISKFACLYSQWAIVVGQQSFLFYNSCMKTFFDNLCSALWCEKGICLSSLVSSAGQLVTGATSLTRESHGLHKWSF